MADETKDEHAANNDAMIAALLDGNKEKAPAKEATKEVTKDASVEPPPTASTGKDEQPEKRKLFVPKQARISIVKRPLSEKTLAEMERGRAHIQSRNRE